MSPSIILIFATLYFGLLFLISWVTGKDSSNETFFVGKRESPWYLVAFGMIGASLSGITFISVPGAVGGAEFGYMQMVLGNFLGYGLIAFVLLPLYYRLNLTTIYTYLEKRFGFWGYKTGAGFFLLSRIIGASLRMYLVAAVLHTFVFSTYGLPFWFTVALAIALIWLYTFRGGIKTVVWTDSLQTFTMLLALFLGVYFIGKEMNLGLGEMISAVRESDYSQTFFWDFSGKNFTKSFPMQLLNGAAIAFVMVGLDQDMMQKNLTCRNIKDAQKNMIWFSSIFVLVNLVFLFLGALLFLFMSNNNIAMPTEVVGEVLKNRPDLLFPEIALNHLNPFMAGVFVIGLLAAAYSSADSALTSLTTSFCIDFLNFNKGNAPKKTRYLVHIGFSVLLFFAILIFRWFNDDSIVWWIFKMAGYTYGPLLGLFAFGLLTKRKVPDVFFVLLVCLIAPIVCYFISSFSTLIFNGYQVGFELLLFNGLLTFCGLWVVSLFNVE